MNLRKTVSNCLVGFVFVAGITPTDWSSAVAQETAGVRLTAPKLFPEKTLAYLRIDDVVQLREDLAKSSLGKLGNDDNLKPILSEFYGSLVRNTEQLQDAIGLNLDELLSIPNGEMAVALLPNNRARADVETSSEEDGGRRVNVRLQQPAIAVLLDAGTEISSVQIMLDRMDAAASQRMVHEEKTMDRLTLHRYSNPERSREQFAYFIDDGVVVACSDPDYTEMLARKWLGQMQDAKTLADNRKFTGIMARCVGTEGERPQVSFYADPWAMVRELSPKSGGTTMTLAVLDSLGVSGVEAVGGSWIVAPPDFDSISHMHLQLSNPRRGVLSLLRPKSGSTQPESWIPDSVASYSTINWDLNSTLQGIERLFNQFRGEDALEKEVFSRVSDQLGIDFRQDVLNNLEGRLTIVQGFVRPVTLNSGSNVYAIRMNDIEKFKSKVLPSIVSLVEKRTEVSTDSFGELRVYKVRAGRTPPADAPIRQPEVCLTTIDDYVVIADSEYMLRQIAGCINGTEPPLVDSLEFQLIIDRITAQLQDRECSAISFARPEESLQLFYELARDRQNVDRLRQVAGNNGFFKALLAALENHELPPFSVIAKYLAPGGGFLVEEETGLHYMSFSLRRE